MKAIWAQSRDGVIGDGNTMPWHLPEDLQHFKDHTLGQTVIMGSRTWLSLPERFRPLPGRENIVVSRQSPGPWSAGATVINTLAGLPPDSWVMGGGRIYAATLPMVEEVVRTIIDIDLAEHYGAAAVYAPPTTGFELLEETDWRTSAKGRFFHDDSAALRYKFQWLRRPSH